MYRIVEATIENRISRGCLIQDHEYQARRDKTFAADCDADDAGHSYLFPIPFSLFITL